MQKKGDHLSRGNSRCSCLHSEFTETDQICCDGDGVGESVDGVLKDESPDNG